MSAVVRASFLLGALVVGSLASSACSSSDDAAADPASERGDTPSTESTATDPAAAPDLAEAPASTGNPDAGHADASTDGGKPAPAPNGKTYRLPWTKGTTMRLTQDCDDSCCSDHVNSDEYAWDWANGSSFQVRAARGGTITHFKINSTKGCATTACSTDVNMIVVDHGDGTQAIYMHLAGNTAAPGITCGAKVTQGQPLAMAGTTGHSTGIHLHFQVSQVHKGADTCECGTNGKQCATTFNPYPNTWVNGGYHTLPIAFDEWPSASTCNDRRMNMPAALSQ